jgi:arylsulfatase A-like enzyme
MRVWAKAAVVLAAAAGLAPAAASAAPPVPRPNVVVIETDDQTAASMWAMPIVQRTLADEGTTFDNSFVSYALCCPSRATFLTGQYAHNNKVFDNVLPFGSYYRLDSTNTLAVWLQSAGYRTMHVGKYLNRYGTRDAREIPPGWTDWFTSVDPSTYRYYGYTLNENGSLVTYPETPENYQTDVYARLSSNLIAGAPAAGKPFFLWTTFTAPHYSMGESPEPDDPSGFPTPVPAPRDRNRFAGEPLPRPPSFDEADVSDKPDTIRRLPRLTDARIAAIQENYQQELETLQAVDRAVGQILETLRRTGQLDNTLVVFTSDNGYYHGEHRRPREKILPYEPAIRVPLIVRGPGLPRGQHVSQLVSNQDLAPTILGAAHVAPGRTEDGRSLLPLIRHPEIEPGRDLLIEGLYREQTPAVSFAGVRTQRWFYAQYSNGDRELYDLVGDPFELVSRHGDPSYATIEGKLAGRLARLRTCKGASCLAHPQLRVRLRYHPGHTRRGRPCAASAVRVSLSGRQRGQVRDVDLYVNGRLVASRLAEPPRFRVQRRHLPRGGGTAVIRPTAYLSADRAYTPTARVRICPRKRPFLAAAGLAGQPPVPR